MGKNPGMGPKEAEGRTKGDRRRGIRQRKGTKG